MTAYKVLRKKRHRTSSHDTTILHKCFKNLSHNIVQYFIFSLSSALIACWKKTALKVEFSHYECIVVHYLVVKGVELLSTNFTHAIII